MHPQIQIFIFEIRAYPLFIVLALATAVIGPSYLAKRSGLSARRAFGVFLAMAISGLIGARALHVFANLSEYLSHPGLIANFSLQGQSLFGGILFALVAGILASRRFRLDIWHLGDLCAPFLGLALVLARIGCLLNGCCYGVETSQPWGLRFPILSEAHRRQLSEDISGLFSVQAVHPTQIYEMLAGLLIALFSAKLINKKAPRGTAILFAGLSYSLFRLAIQPLRASSLAQSAPAGLYPAIYAGFAIACLTLLAINRKKTAFEKISDYDYILPERLIAQAPAEKRDHSRLLILDKKSGAIAHKRFFDLPDYLRAGDVLVVNDSRVFPARLIGKKVTGGEMEIFLLRFLQAESDSGFARYSCLVGGRRPKQGLKIFFAENLEAELIKDNQDGTWEAIFNAAQNDLSAVAEKIGQTPLPPYIRASVFPGAEDKERYQTVYADKAKSGSVAAPTAGLHFTPELIEKIKSKGIIVLSVTLHVGLGTFAPVKTDNISEHKMHSEWVMIKKETIQKIAEAKAEGRRVIAVGTTAARSLEAAFGKHPEYTGDKNIKAGAICDYQDWVDIFIRPGYRFKAVDALITNFHLPKSTLLMLVSALAGRGNVLRAYEEAIKSNYRFFSYGDAMLVAEVD